MIQKEDRPKFELIRGRKKEREQRIMDHLERQAAYGEEWEPVSLSLVAESEYPEFAFQLWLLICALESAASDNRERAKLPEIVRAGARGLMGLAAEMERKATA